MSGMPDNERDFESRRIAAGPEVRAREEELPMDPHSEYWGMDASACADSYLRRLRVIKAQSMALSVTLGTIAIWSVWNGLVALWLLGLLLIIACAQWSRMRIARLFLGLMGIVMDDCDVARYRLVLDVLESRDRLGRSARAIEVERAYCDYLESRAASALERLENVDFGRRDRSRRYRVMQIEFASCLDTGDYERARSVLGSMGALAAGFRKGSRNRRVADEQIVDFTLMLRPPVERVAADADVMRDRVAHAGSHCRRVSWQLMLAEYELLHGSRESALRLLGDPGLEPMAPRFSRMRDELVSRLGGDGN